MSEQFHDCLFEVEWTKDIIREIRISEEIWNAHFGDVDVKRVSS